MPGPYDFRDPFVYVALVKETGEKFPLWMRQQGGALPRALVNVEGDGGGVTSGSEIEFLRDMPFVTEVEVEIGLGYNPIIRVVLNPPFMEGMALINSDIIEWGSTAIEVYFGYASGTVSPVFSGVCLKPEVQIGADISITLNAQGAMFGALRTSTAIDFPTPTKRIDIIRKLIEQLRSQNMSLEIDEEYLANNAGPDVAPELHSEIVITQARQTVWSVVQTMFDQSKCTFLITPAVDGGSNRNRLRIIPKNKFFGTPPKRKFTLFNISGGRITPSNIGEEGGSYPITSFSSPTSAVYLPAKIVKGITSSDLNPDTREEWTEIITDANADIDRTGTEGAQGSGDIVDESIGVPEEDQMQFVPGNPREVDFSEQARAEFQRLGADGQLMGIVAEVETLGIPDLMPGEVVAIDGVGIRFNGNYGLTKVTQTYGSSGYSTSYSGICNSSSVIKALQAAGQVNTAPPPETASPGDETVTPTDGRGEA